MPTTSTQFANSIIANLHLTQAEEHELLAIETKQNICELLGWSEEYFNAFLYGTAINYLTFYTNADEPLITLFERSKLFWAWFKNQWVNDDVAIVSYLHSLPFSQRYEQYAHFHNAVEMKENLRICRTVLRDVLPTLKKK